MNQKIENVLNLAMEVTEEERQKSLELDVGFDESKREWDLIVRYSGEITGIQAIASRVVQLLNGYAIVTVSEELVDAVASLPEVEYVEKPKRLFFQVINGKRVSCINLVQDARITLFGKGVLIGIIDSGIDIFHKDFRRNDGTTRIRTLWDQTIEGNPPEGYMIGSLYNEDQINEIVANDRNFIEIPGLDLSGHGTAVTGIAAGNGNSSDGRYAGVAPESVLLIVKLGSPRRNGFPRTTELIQAIDFIIKRAVSMNMPLAVNISFGNTYGSHDGTTLLERYMDSVSDYGRTCICVGMGNEGGSAGHTSGVLGNNERMIVELAIQQFEPSVNIQIWKSYVDEMDVAIISPSGQRIGPFEIIPGVQKYRSGDTEILIYFGEPSPYSINQEIYMDFIPANDFIDPGIWKIELIANRIVNGKYDLWLPGGNVLNQGTGFLFPNPDSSLTIPAAASRVISVGAYDARTFSYADFSGRGFVEKGVVSWNGKPDFVAPGVNVITSAQGGGYWEVTGTSFATPFVTGSAALLMEWGIVNGNDSFLYGEKVKAYFRRGAKILPGFLLYPNAQVGFGALCVRDSLPF